MRHKLPNTIHLARKQRALNKRAPATALTEQYSTCTDFHDCFLCNVHFSNKLDLHDCFLYNLHYSIKIQFVLTWFIVAKCTYYARLFSIGSIKV